MLLCVALRGHLRQSFQKDDLFLWLDSLSQQYELRIFLHTWNIQQSSLSYRPLTHIPLPVTPEMLQGYFRHLWPLVYAWRIDEDGNLPLIGVTEGTMFQGRGVTPLRGWKNMIYGNWVLSHMVAQHLPPQTMVINTRFDMFDVYHLLRQTHKQYPLLNLDVTTPLRPREIRFCLPDDCFGVDNMFVTTALRMEQLLRYVHQHLDTFMAAFDQPIPPECLFVKMARALP